MGADFTPGPWGAWGDGRVTEAAEQKLVCKVHSLRNAHLIAAAPELYAELEHAKKLLALKGLIVGSIDNVLAKARGE